VFAHNYFIGLYVIPNTDESW